MFRESCLNDSSCLQLFWQLIAGSCRWNIAFLASRRLVFHSLLLISFVQLSGCSFVRSYVLLFLCLPRFFPSFFLVSFSVHLELAIKDENDEGFNDRSIVLDTGTYRKVSRSMSFARWYHFRGINFLFRRYSPSKKSVSLSLDTQYYCLLFPLLFDSPKDSTTEIFYTVSNEVAFMCRRRDEVYYGFGKALLLQAFQVASELLPKQKESLTRNNQHYRVASLICTEHSKRSEWNLYYVLMRSNKWEKKFVQNLLHSENPLLKNYKRRQSFH